MTGTQKSEIDLDRLPAILAAEARGEPIGAGDAELLRRAEADDPALRAEAPLWAAIGKLGDPRADGHELSDAVMLQRVLARASVEPAPASVARPRAAPRPALRRGFAASIVGVAAAATLLAALAAELVDGPAQAPPPTPGRSEALDPGGAVQEVPSVPPSAPGAPAPDPGAPASEPPPGPPESAPAATGAPASEPPPGPPESAPAATGAAEVTGRAPQPPRPRAEEPAMSAEALLLRAQSRLAQGKSAEASAAYRDLLAQHPSSPEARAALVSLGQLALHQGKTAAALGHFERYLAGGGGSLAAEARVGRIQCLRRLGRTADERAAIADFLARHGASVHAPRLRARLSELGGG